MELTDNDIMPFGAHKGKKLIDVPDHYLLWLNGQIEDKSKLHWSYTEKLLNKYINENVNKTNSTITGKR